MIHAHLIEGYEGVERDNMNADLLARSRKVQTHAETLGAEIPPEWQGRIAPLDAALASLNAQLPRG